MLDAIWAAIFVAPRTRSKAKKIHALINEYDKPDGIRRDQPAEEATSMVRARKYIVVKRFQGTPKKKDFVIKEYDLPCLQDGQILVKVEWISVDPYLQANNSDYPLPYDQFGYQIGVVQESRNKSYPVGTRVVSHQGWCDYCILDPDVQVNKISFNNVNFGVYKLPELQGLPISLGIGAVGIPGLAAYFGLLEICQPVEGETVVVTTAGGGVGSIVGQIAKLKGCKVIGFTGSDEKVNCLKNGLGFDDAFNYKTEDIHKVLKKAAPQGIDCYFDNVGGELSSAIIRQMNEHGRVAICGSISVHDDSGNKMFRPDVLQPLIMIKQLEVEGFLVFRWKEKWPQAFADLTGWIKNGDVKVREHVTEGFDNIVDAFQCMMNGATCGKVVVKIS